MMQKSTGYIPYRESGWWKLTGYALLYGLLRARGTALPGIRDVMPALEAGNVMALYGVDSKKNQIRWYRRFIL